MGAQDLLNAFYDLDNLVTVEVSMPEDDWEALKNAEPKGEWHYPHARYDWYETTTVTVYGSKAPKSQTFSGVGIIKKSFMGSKSNIKPSLRLDFTKYNDNNEDEIEGLIGTKYMVLNNCVQDDAYIRQPLGYELFRQAGVPSFRCNFAKVIVNGTEMGVYVNLEAMKKRFVKNRFHDNDKGNAYEVELDSDLTPEVIEKGWITYEGFTKFKDERDIMVAATAIEENGLDAARQCVDIDAFLRFFAMETLLKHWDGYTQQLNNTYMYNDVTAVADPKLKLDNINLKFIPSGIDQILQEGQEMRIGFKARLAGLIMGDDGTQKKLLTQITQFADTIFSVKSLDNVVKPLIDRMQATLTLAGAEPERIENIAVVREQVDIVRTEALNLVQ